MRRLQAAKGGLSIETILATTEADLVQLLKGVGFYRRKAVYLQKAAKILRDDFAGDIPKDIKGLVSLPGVGMKMATICMAVSAGEQASSLPPACVGQQGLLLFTPRRHRQAEGTVSACRYLRGAAHT